MLRFSGVILSNPTPAAKPEGPSLHVNPSVQLVNTLTCHCICFVLLTPQQIVALVVPNSLHSTNLFVELHDSQRREDPGTGWRDDLRVGKAHPLHHLGCSLGIGTAQGFIAHCGWGHDCKRDTSGQLLHSLGETGKHQANVQLLTLLTCLTGALCHALWKRKIHAEAASLKSTMKGKLLFCHKLLKTKRR